MFPLTKLLLSAPHDKPTHLAFLILVLVVAIVATTAALRGVAPPESESSRNPQIALASATTPTPVPTYTNLYRNTDEGFSISLPPGWIAHETGGRTPVLTAEVTQGASFLLAEV